MRISSSDDTKSERFGDNKNNNNKQGALKEMQFNDNMVLGIEKDFIICLCASVRYNLFKCYKTKMISSNI